MSTNQDSLPDYYAILQVRPEADAELIRAAYRLLARKFHPDNLPVEQRDDLELVKRVRLINEAFDVLSDPERRAAYDAALQQQAENDSPLDLPGMETRIHLVRCAKSRNTYKMLLVRPAGSSALFRVAGFELLEKAAPSLLKDGAEKPSPALPSGEPNTQSTRSKLARILLPWGHKSAGLGSTVKFPSRRELLDRFDRPAALNFSEINFDGFNCPECHSDFRHADGTRANWCLCGGCHRIYCAGNLENTRFGTLANCPWCSRLARINRTVKPGDQADLPVHGEVGRSKGTLPKLADSKKRELPE